MDDAHLNLCLKPHEANEITLFDEYIEDVKNSITVDKLLLNSGKT